ncbi:MAG: LysM domain-containing protein [Micrococcus sp.]|nr:LysM domain-containing protein [Micrococcus sp.]
MNAPQITTTDSAHAAARPARASWQLNRRGRLLLRGVPVIVVAALATAALVAFLALNFSPTAVSSTESGPQLTVITVSPGDSLWSIAAAIAPEADRYATVESIARLNNLQGGVTLQPGDELFIPAASK